MKQQFGLYAPIPMATIGSAEIAQSVAESLLPLPQGRRDKQLNHGLNLLLTADEVGFDLCLFAERHLGSDMHAWLLAAAIASRFERIRALIAVHPGLWDPVMTAKMAVTLVYNAILHTRFKIITGYKSTPDRVLAMDRGELTGNCGIDTSAIQATFTEQYAEGKIRVVVQAGAASDAHFPNVPNIIDEAKTQDDRQALSYMFSTLELGRPFATAAQVPADRVELLRTAFDRAMSDPALVADAKKMQLDIDTMTGAQSAAAVGRLYATPRAVIDRTRGILAATR